MFGTAEHAHNLRMSFASSTTLVGYTVQRPLSSDEMGDLYLAQHPRLPHSNALKVLSATLTEDRLRRPTSPAKRWPTRHPNSPQGPTSRDGRTSTPSAATAYHLLTGAPPFQQSNPVAVISQHLTASPPSLRDLRLDVARLDSAFAVALAQNPRDRFNSCRAFADALSHGAGAWTEDRSPEAS